MEILVRCAKCQKTIRPTSIEKLEVQGYLREFECPHCQQLLANKPGILITKVVTCYSALICGVAGEHFTAYKNMLWPLGIVFFVVMLSAHLMDHLECINEPTLPKAES